LLCGELPGRPKSVAGAKPTKKVCVPMGGKSVAIAVFRPSLAAPMTDWIGSAGKFIREVDLGLRKADHHAVVCHWFSLSRRPADDSTPPSPYGVLLGSSMAYK
jgi:hypothetical protein